MDSMSTAREARLQQLMARKSNLFRSCWRHHQRLQRKCYHHERPTLSASQGRIREHLGSRAQQCLCLRLGHRPAVGLLNAIPDFLLGRIDERGQERRTHILALERPHWRKRRWRRAGLPICQVAFCRHGKL